MCVYAGLQMPAFVYSMALNTKLQPTFTFPSDGSRLDFEHFRDLYFSPLITVFYVLAFLKPIVATSFLGYFLSADHSVASLQSEKSWPSIDVNVRMDPSYAGALRCGAGIAGAAAGGLIVGAFQAPVLNWLGSLRGLLGL
jgi:hypothetical protein